MGLTMVIDAHDVTPAPGYGAHGPLYRLYLIKPGYLGWRIRRVGVLSARQRSSRRGPRSTNRRLENHARAPRGPDHIPALAHAAGGTRARG
jgi:hypothetical protein